MKMRLADGYRHTTLDAETIVVDTLSARNFRFNESGSFIFRSIIAEETVERTVESLAACYTMPWDRAKNEVQSFTSDLLARGVLVPA